jgi:hypothetical protein
MNSVISGTRSDDAACMKSQSHFLALPRPLKNSRPTLMSPMRPSPRDFVMALILPFRAGSLENDRQ